MDETTDRLAVVEAAVDTRGAWHTTRIVEANLNNQPAVRSQQSGGDRTKAIDRCNNNSVIIYSGPNKLRIFFHSMLGVNKETHRRLLESCECCAFEFV